MKNTKLRFGVVHTFVGVLFLLVGFLSDGTLDLANHDTYYVIAYQHIFWMLALLFFGFGLTHWLLEQVKIHLNRTLSFVHFMLSFVLISVVSFLLLSYKNKTQSTYSDYSVYNEFDKIDTQEQLNFVAAGLLVVFLITQFVFLVSLLVAIFKKIKSLT
jgi:heme/copper-type cytochrome/quinol oxidase subunit 1